MLFINLALFILLMAPTRAANVIRPRITAGVTADPGQFPYIASITWGLPILIPHKHYCAGIIIHELWLLGSAYCMSHIPLIGRVKAKVGKYTMARDDAHVKIHNIKKTIWHNFFNGTVARNDIALSQLSTAITFNAFVKKVKLPSANAALSGLGVIIGWGSISATKDAVLPDVLQAAVVPIISNRVCEAELRNVEGEIVPRYIHHTQICTGSFEDNVSVCIGDGGGPLVQYEQEVAELIGIISWGLHPCGTKTPSVHTRVTSFLDWIIKNIEENTY